MSGAEQSNGVLQHTWEALCSHIYALKTFQGLYQDTHSYYINPPLHCHMKENVSTADPSYTIKKTNQKLDGVVITPRFEGWCVNTRTKRQGIVRVSERFEHECSVIVPPCLSQRVWQGFVFNPQGTLTVESSFRSFWESLELATNERASINTHKHPHAQSSLMYVCVKQMSANKQKQTKFQINQHSYTQTHRHTPSGSTISPLYKEFHSLVCD